MFHSPSGQRAYYLEEGGKGGICISPQEQEVAQYVRLAAGSIGAAMVLYITTQLPDDRSDLKRMGYALGLACAGWNLYVWWRVREAAGGK